ncbi:unnamed protein product [Arctogadus glacialis]
MQMASRSSVDQGHVVVLIAVGPEQRTSGPVRGPLRAPSRNRGGSGKRLSSADVTPSRAGVSQDCGRRVLIGSRVNHNSDSSEERSLRSPQDRNECFYKQHRGADKRPGWIGGPGL